MLTREDCSALDRNDPLASFRERFALPRNLIYLNGNSLGAMPRVAAERAVRVVTEEWAEGLVASWNCAGWYQLPLVLGAKIAQLIGAREDEVVVTDGTGINLYKALAAALRLAGEGRSVILMEEGDFPTNRYTVQGLIGQMGRGHTIRTAPAEALINRIDEHTAAVCLTQANYRTGRLLDMDAINRRCRTQGTLTVWDLSHTAGVYPVDLNTTKADFAVGCTYKYLSGGPGSPAFVFVAKRHQANAAQPLSGWFGHENPFEFAKDYRPAEGIRRMQSGTPPIVSLCLAEAGVDLLLEADIQAVRAKSVALGELFLDLVQTPCDEFGVSIASPLDSAQRGSQVALSHDEGYGIVRALQKHNVIGDYREPNLMRFGFAPLYLRYVDVFDAVATFTELLRCGGWRSDGLQKLPVT